MKPQGGIRWELYFFWCLILDDTWEVDEDNLFILGKWYPCANWCLNMKRLSLYKCHLNYIVISIHIDYTFSARNNSRPLAIFQPFSAFGWPKSILVSQISCTFSMGTAFSYLKNIHFQKNSRPISDPYF